MSLFGMTWAVSVYYIMCAPGGRPLGCCCIYRAYLYTRWALESELFWGVRIALYKEDNNQQVKYLNKGTGYEGLVI